MAGVSLALPERTEVVPSRKAFVDFPLVAGPWVGLKTALEKIYLDELKLDDYLMADFHGASGTPVNLYVAWYDSQQAGRSAHSPRCLRRAVDGRSRVSSRCRWPMSQSADSRCASTAR
ncbi:MAG: EpsI family protein [Proteobacteria bacterium]|nr:EpsI family protein [Pseudomonadota bacterium]